MNPTKTIMLRFKPIEQITDKEMNEEVLTTDGKGHWGQGFVSKNTLRESYYCNTNAGNLLNRVKLYAVLPKGE